MRRTERGDRLYRRLLRLYPREFREDYGDEMARLYREWRRAEGGLRLWLALGADLATTAPAQHFAALSHDVRHAWRVLGRAPLVTVAAILTLAIGVGFQASILSVVHAVVLRPLPYPEPDQLVELSETNERRQLASFAVSALNYLSWNERHQSFARLAAYQGTDFNLTEMGAPERILGSRVTSSIFPLLGVPLIAGRPFTSDDERAGSDRVVVLSERLWRQRFGGDRFVLDRTIVLNGEAHRIVGIVPRTFAFGRMGDAQILAPLAIDPARENRSNHVLRVVGRLRPGVGLDRARTEMRTIASGLAQDFPASNQDWSVRIETLYDGIVDARLRDSLLALLGAVAALLLIACTNLANLLLARGLSRSREFAVRTALGAGRTRLVRQLLTESVCLAGVSSVCAVAVSLVALSLLGAQLPPTLPRLNEIRFDATVVGYCVLVSMVSGLFFGVLPATRLSRLDVLAGLTARMPWTGTRSTSVFRHGLVALQMALATTLLVVAALFVESFVRLQQVPLGIEPDGVVTARIALPRTRYADAEIWNFYRQLLDDLRSLGHVRAAGITMGAPFAPGIRPAAALRDAASSHDASDPGVTVAWQVVSPDYFRAVGMTMLEGRTFGDTDRAGAPLVTIVSAGAARQVWPGQPALGRRLEWNGLRQHEVVGVVNDVRDFGPRREAAATIYFPAAQLPERSMTLVVNAAGDPGSIVRDISDAVTRLDRSQPIYNVRPLDDWVAASAAQPRLLTLLTTLFAGAGVLLAAVGVFGVLAYSASQRLREIGVRLALGATRRQVIALIVRGGMSWALAGIVVGLSGAFVASRAIQTLLFDAASRVPAIFVGVAATLGLVALLACYLPTARAARVDPLATLRSE